MMNENSYIEKLNWFKQNEKPETMLLVADNPDRIKLIIAWTNTSVGQTETISDFDGKSDNEIWDWLWENVTYSKSELKEKADVASEIVLENKMKPLIGNRVIYPDGSINSYVQRYLREQVVKLFETKSRKPAIKP
jgi:hypothetical protein